MVSVCTLFDALKIPHVALFLRLLPAACGQIAVEQSAWEFIARADFFRRQAPLSSTDRNGFCCRCCC
jgi:hypothetical protein